MPTLKVDDFAFIRNPSTPAHLKLKTGLGYGSITEGLSSMHAVLDSNFNTANKQRQSSKTCGIKKIGSTKIRPVCLKSKKH